MRRIGTLENKQNAERFTDFLLTEGIVANAQEESGAWAIWVRDEDHVERTRKELAPFLENPEEAKYAATKAKAAEIRRQEATRIARSKPIVDVRTQVWTNPTARQVPVTAALIVLSVAVALFSGMGHQRLASPMRELSLCDPAHNLDARFVSQRDGWIDIQAGQVWRIITPIFIHFSIPHIVFNLWMLYPLASRIEMRSGSLLLAFLTVAIGGVSNAGQFWLEHSPWFGGMSGVLYGLFGYAWVRMNRHPEERLFVSSQTITILIIWMILGFLGTFEAINIHMANGAHLFGLLSGVALGFALPTKRR